MFHPIVSTWFERRFGGPTSVQERAWPRVAAGGDALITAPTGSGKTLAAFLYCLDGIIRRSLAGELTDETSVVYVSPLRALSNDVQKNLEVPLAEILEVAAELGQPMAPVRTAVRTGDTSQKGRRESVKRPPHVLVTTPESLFLLLTSASGRRGLSTVRTIILDEIHALAGDKRGAHLALSVERLEDLVVRSGGARPQRIGLSATIRPIDVAARLLVGTADPPAIVDAGQRRDLDLAVLVPRDELGAVSTNEQWVELYDRVTALVREHRQTLVFVNTRRLAERVTHALSERLGDDAVAAHHGSLSRARRHSAEQRLKAGTLRAVVATASLELGIDVGAVDLTCVVGSPRAIGTALQRIGRSGHALRATPKGRLFPLTRDQLVECAAIVRAARRGNLDTMALRDAPLDVLAQQIVAICAAEDRSENEVFELVRRAAPYASLDRSQFDAVIGMLAEGIATRRGRSGTLLHRDAVNERLRGRRGARLAALTSGGAIPDNANYDVLQTSDASKVGTLDEDFAIESMAGDVFLLGNTSWRIKRVEMGKVWVDDAQGAAPTIPFWVGEGPSRTTELSSEVSELRAEILARHDAEVEPGATVSWLGEACALDRSGAELTRDYILAARAALGAIPGVGRIVAERFFDESGGMQLVLHAPFGGRINRAIGLLLRKRFCRTFDFELQAAATDDGVLLSLGPQHSFPLEAVTELLRPENLREVLEQAALQAPIFGTRFRWNATRSLALLRFRNGKRVPPPLLRMRSDDLLASVFPDQQGCQDNHGVGAHIEIPDHPLVFETLRDCLCEWMDASGAERVLYALRQGEIGFHCRETPEPSVLSHEILNANPYAFLDDAPLEERRARAVSVRRGLPADVVDRIGGLDQDAIARVTEEAKPDCRHADELHDLLLELGALPEAEGAARGWDALFRELASARRASRLSGPSPLWVAAERRSLAAAAWPARSFDVALHEPGGPRPVAREAALAVIVRARLGISGPVTTAELASDLDLDPSDVDIALAQVELEGNALRGRFRAGAADLEWCDRRLLARIHRATTQGLRRAIEPVSVADLMRFLFAWQGVRGARPTGHRGLLRVFEQLQGFELAAGAWEEHVLRARVPDYRPEWTDELCLSGEIAWGRFSPRDTGSAPTRSALVTFAKRADLTWLLAAGSADAAPAEDGLGDSARAVLLALTESGASFFDDIVLATARHRDEVEDALWELVAKGRVTGDGFSGLRALIDNDKSEPSFRIGRFRGPLAPIMAGRWALLRAPRRATDLLADDVLEAQARQYLRRYGVVFKDLLAREPRAPSYRDLLRIYRRLEMRGEIRGGRLVASFVGEQFALPEALEALRAIRREPAKGDIVRLSACDPLNLVGIVTPGPRIAAHLGNSVAYRDGIPTSEAERPMLNASSPAGS